MSLLALSGTNSVSGGYDIDNSLKFEPDNTESLTKSAATGGDRKKATLSFWCKRTELTNSQQVILFLTGVNGNKYTSLGWGTGDEINFHYYNAGTYPYNFLTDRVFRDTSAWYHIVVAVDTTQSTASDRVKFYVNGVQETSFSTEVYPTQNIDTPFNNDSATYPMEIGNDSVFSMGGEALAGYLADYYLIDGQQLAPTEFGEVDEDSGIWKPKAYEGTYGTNGFYLDFESSGSLGADSSGNSNNFTPINITSADQATDTPTNNFATGNPLGPFRVGAWNFTEGATYAQYAGGNDWGSFTNTIAVGSGKWYVEIQAGGSDLFIGAGSEDFNFVGAGSGTGFPEIYYGYTGTNSVGYHANNGDVYNNGTQVVIGTTYTTNDIISVALDMDNGKIYFAKNGTYINSQNPATGANSIALPDTSARYFIGGSSYGTGKNHRCNYGGYTSFTISSSASDANGYGTFEYAPPSGYYALCTKNLAEYG
jgi:hypothetical protein